MFPCASHPGGAILRPMATQSSIIAGESGKAGHWIVKHLAQPVVACEQEFFLC